MRPKKDRLTGHSYFNAIICTKKVLGLKYGEIAEWMNITNSNLRACISQSLNPTSKEWFKFKRGLRLYRNNKPVDSIKIKVPLEWMMLCEICLDDCLRRAHNQKTCRNSECKRELRRRRRSI